MKKVFSLLSLASLLILAISFIPAKTVAEDVALVGSGKFYGCPTALSPATATYRLYHQPTGNEIFGDANCMPDFLTLAPGEWDIYATCNVNAYMYFQWHNCGVDQDADGNVLATVETYIDSFFVPCN